MKQRPLGNTGILVSEIGLGAWQLGNRDWNGPDRAESHRIVHEALESGINFFDTAPGYAEGRSEEYLGEALQGSRDRVVICTKFGYDLQAGANDWDPRRIERSVEQSCRALRTDYLDVVLMHNPPEPMLDGARTEHYEVFEQLRQRGLIRAYGASVDWAADLRTVMRTTGSQAAEVRLSALYQEPWDAVVEAGQRGVGTIIKVPLESGWLSGRYSADTRFTDVRSRWTPEEVAERAALVEELKALLPADVKLSQAALRFLLANPGVSTVIPGAKSVEQLRDALAAAQAPLPPEVVDRVRGWSAQRFADQPLGW